MTLTLVVQLLNLGVMVEILIRMVQMNRRFARNDAIKRGIGDSDG